MAEEKERVQGGGKNGIFWQGVVMVALTFLLSVVTQGFGIYHFSTLKASIAETLGVTSTQAAFAYSFYALSMAFVGLFVGSLIAKKGMRLSLLLSAIFYGGGFFLLSVTNSLPMLYVTYIVMGAGSSLGGIVVITSIPSNWFVKHRGTANGVIWSATFFGSLFVSNFIAFVVELASWQFAVRCLAIIAIVIILVVSIFLKWRPQDIGLLPDGVTKEQAAQENETAGSAKVVGLTRAEALRTPTFWLFGVAIFLIGFCEMGAFQNVGTYVTSLGHPLTIVATCMSLIGLLGFFSKLIGGFVIDKLGAKITYFIVECLACAGLLMFAFSGDSPSMVYLYVSVALFGIGENASIVCFSATTGKFFGIKNYAQIFAMVFLCKAIGDAVGAPAIAWLAESTSLGWTAGFGLSAILAMLSAVIFAFGRKEPALIKMEEQAAAELEREKEAQGQQAE